MPSIFKRKPSLGRELASATNERDRKKALNKLVLETDEYRKKQAEAASRKRTINDELRAVEDMIKLMNKVADEQEKSLKTLADALVSSKIQTTAIYLKEIDEEDEDTIKPFPVNHSSDEDAETQRGHYYKLAD